MTTPRERRETRFVRELGRRLRDHRESRGLTQAQLAKRAGVTADMLSRLENGRFQSPGMRTILRVADALGVSVGALLPDAPKSGAGQDPIRARLRGLSLRLHPDDAELLLEIGELMAGKRR